MDQTILAVDRARLARLIAEHQARYRVAPAILSRAPGRINLIGEHTDYNDGFVLPAAIDRDIVLVATPRDDHRFRLHSLNLTPAADLDLDALQRAGAWHDYPAGVAVALAGAGYALRGLDVTLDGTVPLGGGLSSSAALEVATARALVLANGLTIPERELALLCQRAENDFVGASTGIMDQFVSIFGQRDSALFLDCRTLAVEVVRLSAPDLRFAVCDSGVKHELAGGEYNRRRAECAAAVERLRAVYPALTSLRDLTPGQLERASRVAFDASSDVLYRRARHVVGENARVLATVAALRARDWSAVGRALYASHASLRDDYEVSVSEIDALVELARDTDGVLGSRLMGGGFGGSTLTLLRRDALDAFAARVAADYLARTGRQATVHAVTIVAGADAALLGGQVALGYPQL